jgi:hypothetical protein
VRGPRHSAGKDIISRLLDKEENTRLGSKTGASEVKQHKWFSKINWGLLRNTEPPVSSAPWVARLTTAACRFVYHLSPRLWPYSQHMVLLHFCTQSLVNSRSGPDPHVFSDHPCIIKWSGYCKLSPDGGVHVAPSRDATKRDQCRCANTRYARRFGAHFGRRPVWRLFKHYPAS